MKIRKLATQFSILVITEDVDQGATIKVALSQAGYDVNFISSFENHLQVITAAIPHVIIFDGTALKGKLNSFIKDILNLSSEIKFIPISLEADFDSYTKFAEHGISAVVSAQATYFEKRIVWSVDKICESLYLTYQNEELLKATEQSAKELTELQNSNQQMLKEQSSFRGIELLIQSYKTSESQEQILNLFFEQLNGIEALYLKFLPSVNSLIVTHGQGYPEDKISGASCQLEKDEVQEFVSKIVTGHAPNTLNQLLLNVFAMQNPKIFPLFIGEDLEGLCVVSGLIDSVKENLFSQQFSLFSLAYGFFTSEKKVAMLNLHDSVTEVFNGKYYQRKLSDEIQRARRLKHPLSVVKIAIDDFDEIEQTFGDDVRDYILKTVAQLMVKNSRAHDFVSRTKNNEFALTLVHCSKQGAGIRADRLRRAVESTSVLDRGIKLSVSVGLSEYPSLCDSTEGLDQTSTQALQYILDKGGNRLCLYKPAANFQPEFEVIENSGEPHVP